MAVFDVVVHFVADHDFAAAPDFAHVQVAADGPLDASLAAAQMVAAVGFHPVSTDVL